MTHTHRNIGRLATAVILALLACTLTVQATAETAGSLSKKELKTLSATPAGNERLAIYYRDKAQHLRDKSQEFSAQADHLATQPAMMESKQGISCNCTAHYRYFSKLSAQEAKDAETLAARHEQLAEGYKSGSENQQFENGGRPDSPPSPFQETSVRRQSADQSPGWKRYPTQGSVWI